MKDYFALMCVEYFGIFLIDDRVRCLKYLHSFSCVSNDLAQSLKDIAHFPDPIREDTVVGIYDEKTGKY